MKNKIVGILIFTMLITTAIPVVAIIENDNQTICETSDNYDNSIQKVTSSNCNPGDWLEQIKLFALDGVERDLFGTSVSIDGEYALIGAYGYDSWRGSAYVFKRSGTSWTQEAKLLASDGTDGDEFGRSVYISGDYAIIGAINDDVNGITSSGSAYIFKRIGTTWSQEAKIFASDGTEWDLFGISVSIDGDYAIVGASFDDENGYLSGSAYIFKRSGTTWSQETKLLATDGEAEDRFGVSVSISGDYVFVGASRGNNNNNIDSGTVYVYKHSGTTWLLETKLLASDGDSLDKFGASVSIDGDYLITGAPGDDDNGNHSGSAYIFKCDDASWTEKTKLLASDGAEEDWFGYSVSIYDNYAIVGALYDDTQKGSAYVFKRSGTTWSQDAKLLASDGEAEDSFGCSVSISGDYAIVGALFGDNNVVESGAAYVFNKPRTNLKIGSVDGQFKIQAYICNYGPVDAENVKWSIKIDGGIMLFPSGGVVEGSIGIIEADPTKPGMISTFVLGFGGFLSPLNIVVSAEADNADPVEKTLPAKILLFMILW